MIYNLKSSWAQCYQLRTFSHDLQNPIVLQIKITNIRDNPQIYTIFMYKKSIKFDNVGPSKRHSIVIT
jgi:hypothetical protein